MSRITPITTDHQMILEGLEVLTLMADRLEMEDFVEPDDISAVMNFLRDVGCKCLEHTEHLLLRPALAREKNRQLVRRLKTAVACHQTVRPLFEDAVSDTTPSKSFVLHAHLLTKVIGDLILEEDYDLLEQVGQLLDDAEGHRHIDEFTERERNVSAVAVERLSRMHQLEAKYAYPQVV